MAIHSRREKHSTLSQQTCITKGATMKDQWGKLDRAWAAINYHEDERQYVEDLEDKLEDAL